MRTLTTGAAIVVLAVAGLRAQSSFSAKVVLENGTPLPTVPMIVPEPTARLMAGCAILNVFGNGTIVYAVNPYSRPYDPQTMDQCVVKIRLKGYQTTVATLRNGGTVVLKRIGGDHEGSTVSMTSLKAPEKARKAYEKGMLAVADEKWANAGKEIEKAVEIYPEYAQAWCDLGEVYLHESKPAEARAAYEKAIQAEPKYIRPYVQLARLDLAEKKFQEALTLTNKAMEQNPIEFPGIYFFNAVANFSLQHYAEAEKSARRAIELDANGEIPRARHLLGLLLAGKGERAEAIQLLNKYLELSPKAPDAEQVRQQIAKLQGQGQTAP
jgi:tetratricopeptide (TPR) repeat protein